MIFRFRELLIVEWACLPLVEIDNLILSLNNGCGEVINQPGYTSQKPFSQKPLSLICLH